MEAAIQKYGLTEPCRRIGLTPDVGVDRVLQGVLMTDDFEPERKMLESTGSQLVLTDFGVFELQELYIAERLSHEIWKFGAMLRIVGKGAEVVLLEDPPFVADARSDKLAKLVQSYDSRHTGSLNSTAAAVWFKESPLKATGTIFFPVYNVGHVGMERISSMTETLYNTRIDGVVPNFLWTTFELSAFRRAHQPFADGFRKKYGVGLDDALVIVACIHQWVFRLWVEHGFEQFLRSWQRGYQGPSHRDLILDQLRSVLPEAKETLGIADKEVCIDKGFSFWNLMDRDRDVIDLPYAGPHQIFLPYGTEAVFVDFAWVLRRMFDMFHGVKIGDQSFKGAILEAALGAKSFLPLKQCRAVNGTSKQIDFAVVVGSHLVIAECKAVAKAIAFDRGSPTAISFRTEKVVERSLSEVDEKARWLASNPIGRNYSLSGLRDIIPVGISPFTEYIPTLAFRYWIDQELPRVMTPLEFRDFIGDTTKLDVAQNRVPICFE